MTFPFSFLLKMLRRFRRLFVDNAAEELREIGNKILAMPLAEARKRALQILSDEKCFRSTVASRPFTAAFPLPDALRELFDKYDRIEIADGRPIFIDRKAIHRLNRFGEFVCIGKSDMGALQSDICFRPGGGERVYDITEDPETLVEIEKEAYPSIHHWIIDIYAILTRETGTQGKQGQPWVSPDN